VSFILIYTKGPYMQSVVKLNVIILSVDMLNATMLGVIMLSVIYAELHLWYH
jgi:hypothetical protein